MEINVIFVALGQHKIIIKTARRGPHARTSNAKDFDTCGWRVDDDGSPTQHLVYASGLYIASDIHKGKTYYGALSSSSKSSYIISIPM